MLIYLCTFQLAQGIDPNKICVDSKMNSPIDITPPLSPLNFKVEMKILDTQVLRISKISNHVVKVTGEFGLVMYDSEPYAIQNLYFKAPSEHKIQGNRLPLEAQFICYSASTKQINLVVFFQLTDKESEILKKLTFGSGIIASLPLPTPGKKEVSHIINDPVNVSDLFANNNHWIMYEGEDTNIPCGKVRWVISYQPISINLSQLKDFDQNARPDFTDKQQGQRKVFENKNTSKKDLKHMKEKEKDIDNNRSEADKKRKKELDGLRKNEMSKRLGNAMNGNGGLQPSPSPRGPQPSGEATTAFYNNRIPLATNDMLERLMKEIRKFNIKTGKNCRDFIIYRVPKGHKLGWVPKGAKMTWEISDLDEEKVTIKSPKMPSTLHKGLVYKPYFYIAKPKCNHGILEFPPKEEGKKGHHKDSKIKMLAFTSETSYSTFKEFLEAKKKEKAKKKKVDWIPVIAKTLKNYITPKVPTPVYSMWDPVKHKVEPIKIRRHFKKPKKAQKKLKKAQKRAKHTSHKDGGYKIKANKGGKKLVSRPKHFRRVWPVIKADEGLIPGNVLLGWEPIKESEIVLNIAPPKSPNPNFRWIIFFYGRALYKIGKNKKPLVPFYILVHKHFKWTRGKLPAYIPVPRNNVPYKGTLQIQDLEIKFISKNLRDVIRNMNLLLPPRGVDPKKAFKISPKFREVLMKFKQKFNKHYAEVVMKRYSMLEGNLKILKRQECEEMTGMMIMKDRAARREKKRELKKRKLKEKQRKKKLEKKAKKVLKKKEGIVKKKEVVRMRKVCVKRKLEVILNTRHMKPGSRKFQSRCVSWKWKPIYTISQWKEHQVYLKKLRKMKRMRSYCLNHLHVVLNTHGKQLSTMSPSFTKKCRQIYSNLKKDRTNHILNHVTPLLNQIGGTLQIKTNLMKLNPNLIPFHNIPKGKKTPKSEKTHHQEDQKKAAKNK